MDLYIYYRARSEHSPQLQAQVQAMQTRLRGDHGIAAALKRRPQQDDIADTGDISDTWMEVYLDVPADFESSLQRAVDGAALTTLIDGVRHIEHFQDCTPCV